MVRRPWTHSWRRHQGAVNNAVLYTTSAGNLGASSTLTYDGSANLSYTASPFLISGGNIQFRMATYDTVQFCSGTTAVFTIYIGGTTYSTIGFTANDSLITFTLHSTIIVSPYNATTTPFGVRGLASQAAPLVSLQQLSSTSAARSCGYIDATFNSSTDSTWSGNLLLYAGDYTSTNAVSGSASRSSPTARQLSLACSE